METKSTHSLTCPYCQGSTRIAAIHCPSCEITVEGNFAGNEFARLGAEDLHFLRTFLACEGRIRDMEAPLGLSYPTIRSRLSDLKERVLHGQAAQAFTPAPAQKPQTQESETQTILSRLEQGELSFAESVALLRKAKKKERK